MVITNFPEWNNQGENPPQNVKDVGWQPLQRPPAQYVNWFWYGVYTALQELDAKFQAIDSNDDDVVNTADYANDADASTYKGNDIDTNGDGIVNTADYANDSDASTYKGNDIDSNGDGVVDNAENINGINLTLDYTFTGTLAAGDSITYNIDNVGFYPLIAIMSERGTISYQIVLNSDYQAVYEPDLILTNNDGTDSSEYFVKVISAR